MGRRGAGHGRVEGKMTKQQALGEIDQSCRKNLEDALGELDGSGIIYFISEVKRTLLTQCLYALLG